MTKISYEEKDNKATVELYGNSSDIFRGICRIVANAKEKLELKKDAKESFEELLLKGIKSAEREKKVNELLEDKEDDVDALIKMLEKLLDD